MSDRPVRRELSAALIGKVSTDDDAAAGGLTPASRLCQHHSTRPTIKPPRVASAPIDTAVITTIVAPDYLLRRLLAGGKQSSPGWCPGNPAVADGVAAHLHQRLTAARRTTILMCSVV